MEGFDTITIRGAGQEQEEILELVEFERRIEAGEIDLFTEVRFPPLTGAGFTRVGEIESFRRLVQPRGIYLERAFHLGRIPTLTLLLCGLNLAVFSLQQRNGPVDAGVLIAFGAKAGPLIDDLGQIWRLFTANFVHLDALHIGFNLFVLFHFGAAVENAYRLWDYVLIWVASALGTTVASYAMTGAITMGASGVAYGLLGSAVVFGLKYRRALPRRYRAVLGAATIPTVFLFLYMGWTSEGIDNWSHLGGLVAGSLTTLPLQPRLLGPGPGPRSVLLFRLLPLAGVALVLVAGPPVLGATLPQLVKVERPHLGLAVSVPKGWQARGQGIFSNALPLHGRASLALALQGEGRDPADAVRRWSEGDLARTVEQGQIQPVEVGPIVPSEVGGMDAATRRFELLVDGVPTVLVATFATHQGRLYSVVTTRPVALPAYDRVLEEILGSLEVLGH